MCVVRRVSVTLKVIKESGAGGSVQVMSVVCYNQVLVAISIVCLFHVIPRSLTT